MQILTAFVRSLYDVSWLRSNKQAPGKAWSYFFILMWVFSLLTLVYVASLAPGIYASGQKAIGNLPNFDAELKDGKLTVAKLPQPYIAGNAADFLVVIDTVATNTISVKDFLKDSGQSGLLIASNRMELYEGSRAQSRVEYFGNSPNIQINKQALDNVFRKLVSPGAIILMIFAGLVGLFIGFTVSKLVSLFIVVLLVRLACILSGKAWGFKQLFVVGLFSVTLPSLITFVFSLLSLNFAYLHFLLLLAFMLAVVFTKEEGVKAEEAK